jgi:hypothetical protein
MDALKILKKVTRSGTYKPSLAFSPDGRRIVSAAYAYPVLWNVKTGKKLKTYDTHSCGGSWSAAFSPDGKNVLIGGINGNTCLVNMVTGFEENLYESHAKRIFSPDEKYILTGQIYSVAFSADGKYIVTGGLHTKVMLWDTESGDLVKTFNGHTGIVTSVAFSPDGRHIASGGEDRNLILWDSVTGRQVNTFKGHTHRIKSIAFSPGGKYIVSGGMDGNIKISETQTGELLMTLVGLDEKEWVAYTPDNYYNSSEKGNDYVSFRAGNSILGPEEFTKEYKKPEIIAGLLESDAKVTEDVLEKGKSLPELARSYFGRHKSWAVVIGINNYSLKKGWKPLPYAVNDAKAVKELLINHMGFSEDHIITLYDNRATKKEIERLLGDELPSKVKPDDRVLVFFSGHGDTRKARRGDIGYLVPVDGDSKSPHATYLAMNQIQNFSDLIPAKQVLFIVDACYSGIAGIIFKGKKEEETRKQVEVFIKSGGRQVLTAGTSDEKVTMSKKWNNHSIYTYYLLAGLKGAADYNSDGVISTRELQVHLDTMVPRESNQHPQMFNLGSGEGNFIFYKEGDL